MCVISDTELRMQRDPKWKVTRKVSNYNLLKPVSGEQLLYCPFIMPCGFCAIIVLRHKIYLPFF